MVVTAGAVAVSSCASSDTAMSATVTGRPVSRSPSSAAAPVTLQHCDWNPAAGDCMYAGLDSDYSLPELRNPAGDGTISTSDAPGKGIAQYFRSWASAAPESASRGITLRNVGMHIATLVSICC